MIWCTYLQSFEKIHQCVFEFETKRDGQGALQYLPSRAFGAAGDNKTMSVIGRHSLNIHTYIKYHIFDWICEQAFSKKG